MPPHSAEEDRGLYPLVNDRPRERLSAHLIQDDNGRPLTALALRSRFDKARKAAA
jgi:hypothetical protein